MQFCISPKQLPNAFVMFLRTCCKHVQTCNILFPVTKKHFLQLQPCRTCSPASVYSKHPLTGSSLGFNSPHVAMHPPQKALSTHVRHSHIFRIYEWRGNSLNLTSIPRTPFLPLIPFWSIVTSQHSRLDVLKCDETLMQDSAPSEKSGEPMSAHQECQAASGQRSSGQTKRTAYLSGGFWWGSPDTHNSTHVGKLIWKLIFNCCRRGAQILKIITCPSTAQIQNQNAPVHQ